MKSSYPNPDQMPAIDFAQHAASLGAHAEKVDGISSLNDALKRAVKADRTYVVVIDTDPITATEAGGTWWDVPVAEVSDNDAVADASRSYKEKQKQR